MGCYDFSVKYLVKQFYTLERVPPTSMGLFMYTQNSHCTAMLSELKKILLDRKSPGYTGTSRLPPQ